MYITMRTIYINLKYIIYLNALGKTTNSRRKYKGNICKLVVNKIFMIRHRNF